MYPRTEIEASIELDRAGFAENGLLDIIGQETTQLCPFCGEYYLDDAEWIHIDMGHYVQVTPNRCENEDCNAYELGGWKMDKEKQVYKHGWVRDKNPTEPSDKYPEIPFDDDVFLMDTE